MLSSALCDGAFPFSSFAYDVIFFYTSPIPLAREENTGSQSAFSRLFIVLSLLATSLPV